jgi:hypothetical protein
MRTAPETQIFDFPFALSLVTMALARATALLLSFRSLVNGGDVAQARGALADLKVRLRAPRVERVMGTWRPI